jgi:hypothetical protein
VAAVYPVQSPFNTNPSYSGTFIPTLWSGKLAEKFYAASTFADCANTDWEGDIKNMGDTVVINTIPTITVSAYTVGETLTYQVPTGSTIDLLINEGQYFAVQISDVLEYQAKPNLMDMFTNDAAMQMKIAIDKDCWLNTFNQGAAANYGATAGVITGAYNLGTDQAPVVLSPTNILPVINALSSVLDEQNVPETDRYLVITPYDRQLLMQSPLAQAQFMGDAKSIQRNGLIGQIDRFEVYVSNLTPTGAAGYTWGAGSSTTESGALKRHALIAGHRSALSFASQINKVESLPNPNDFGQLVRGLNVYGRTVTQPYGLAYATVQ